MDVLRKKIPIRDYIMPLATYPEGSGRSQVYSQCLDREYLLVIVCSVITNMLFGHFQRGLQLSMMSHDLPRAQQSRVDPTSWCPTSRPSQGQQDTAASPSYLLLSFCFQFLKLQERWLQKSMMGNLAIRPLIYLPCLCTCPCVSACILVFVYWSDSVWLHCVSLKGICHPHYF